MSTNWPSYDCADTLIYQTSAYGGSDDDVTTEKYTKTIDLAFNRAACIDIKHDSDGTTDDLVVNIYRSTDNVWDGDEQAINSVTIPSDGSEDIYSLNISYYAGYGPGYYRLGLIRSGSTDTFAVDSKLRYGR